MKKGLLISLVLALSFTLFGCSANQLELNGEIVKKIIVSESENFGKVSSEVIYETEEEAELMSFIKAFKSAKKIAGVLDVTVPNYDVSFVNDNGKSQGYHLWLSEQAGMIMRVNDTNTGYKLSKESVQELNTIMEKALTNDGNKVRTYNR